MAERSEQKIPNIKVFGLLFYNVNAALSCRTYRGGENVSLRLLEGGSPINPPLGQFPKDTPIHGNLNCYLGGGGFP